MSWSYVDQRGLRRVVETGPSMRVDAVPSSTALRHSVKSSHPPPETWRSSRRSHQSRRVEISRARLSSSGRGCGPSRPRARPMRQQRDLGELHGTRERAARSLNDDSAISLQEYTSHSSIREKRRRDTSVRPHIAARTRPELGSRLTQPRRSPHALGSAAQQCAGAPQWSDGGGWTRFCEQ